MSGRPDCDDVPDHLKCCVCLDAPTERVEQCLNGHLLCAEAGGRGVHSSTILRNLSALYGIGGARRGRVARVKPV
jgi:hypothetical protein